MKSKLLVIATFIMLGWQFCLTNPHPEQSISFINNNPPQIGITSVFELDISGLEIATSQGVTTVNEGIILPESWEGEVFILDNSNTSGFAFDPEGDFVSIDELFAWVNFGQYGIIPAPLDNHPLILWPYIDHDYPTEILCYDFTLPLWGRTDIIINEINAHNTWKNNAGFIELYNKSNEDVSLAGWRIVCDEIYEFPMNAVIPANGFYVIDETGFPGLFAMNYDRDNIHLIDNISNNSYTGRVVDQVGWSSDHGADISFMRYPDGDVQFGGYPEFWDQYCGYNDASSGTFENGFPTRGAANRHDCPGFVVIGVAADSIDDGSAKIHWTDPIWDGQFVHSVLAKSSEAYPETPGEGDIIYEGTNQEFTETDIPPTEPVYYTVFAYNTSSEYSVPTDESKTYIWFNAVGIEPESLPNKISAINSYPNPFNAQVTISFSLERQSVVNLSIYDITGRLVDVLTSKTYQAGNHSLIWDACEQPSGIYFARFSAGESIRTTRMVLLK